MGGNSSRESYAKEERELKIKAARNFHNRIQMYHYAYHGNYIEYVEWCRAQYELECIPSYLRQGPAYKPIYDHWGNQEY